MKIRLILDGETAERLAKVAALELRPADLQAEVIIRRVLGTWPEPKPAPITGEPKAEHDQVSE